MRSIRIKTSRTRLVALAALAAGAAHAQPAPSGILPLSELKPGEHGEVWTVFRGTVPEPFSVEVTGVVRNALGPGKSLILCQLTDPRVQTVGAVAGMSGSPLYIDGKLAGALSYQVQTFELVHYAGFTPAADLEQVGDRAADPRDDGAPAETVALADAFSPMRPVFTMSGLSPQVAGLMQPYFKALGLETTALGGSADSAEASGSLRFSEASLRPGDAVAVALATGDISLAAVGTVSSVDGDKIVAFGHPMMGLGHIELPMCSAEIVTIIPSSLESIKVPNTGPIIGTITQDRLSAVSGILGRKPDMIDVDVTVNTGRGAPRVLHFQVARQQQITPALVATGVTQAIVASNDNGLANGFRIDSNVTFSPDQTLASKNLYAGPGAFAFGLADFVKQLAQHLQNPYEKTFPRRVSFTVEPLESNPIVTLDQFNLSQETVRAGQSLDAELEWRDYQGESHAEHVSIPVDPSWTGRNLEVVLAPGPALDELTGRPRAIAPSQLRSFDAYLAAMREDRPSDGICVAVVEDSSLFTDQTESTPDLPGSLGRVAVAADEARFQQRPALDVLWERHLLPGRLSNVVVRRPLRVVD